MAKGKRSTGRGARILIVDDHPSVRDGLALHINGCPDLEVCGEAADSAEALDLLSQTDPNVALVDISLKTSNGLDLIKRMLARRESVRVLVLSMYHETLYAERALRAGAMGYITKHEPAAKIIEAIRRVLDGKVYVSPSMAEQLLNRAVGNGQAKAPPSISTLSDRELEVFRLIGQGQHTREIGKRLHLSPKTVETYRGRIKTKLNLDTGTELIRRAVQWADDGKNPAS